MGIGQRFCILGVFSEASFQVGTPEMESFLSVLQRSGALRPSPKKRPALGSSPLWL